jgi:hypothetical protein
MPTVSAPGDYDGAIGGVMIGTGKRSTQGKPAPVPLCPPQTPHPCPEANPGRRGRKPATNRLSYGTAYGLQLLITFAWELPCPSLFFVSNEDTNWSTPSILLPSSFQPQLGSQASLQLHFSSKVFYKGDARATATFICWLLTAWN